MPETQEKIEDAKAMEPRRISFHFHPFGFDQNRHAVTKQDGDEKRRYLRGVASGSTLDGHGERMTDKCIKSFQGQARSGNILLYEGQHGVNYVDDIGKLTGSDITPTGDWMTEFRLYDAGDGLGENTIEKAEKLWKQVTGSPPYDHPMQKGFSIEGEIPEGGIVQMDDMGRRVIDDVQLDGVVVVPRPAYKDSIAQAVYKALGLPRPWVIQKNLRRTLSEKMDEEQRRDAYFQKKYSIDEALEEEIRGILRSDLPDYREPLGMVFDEYRDLMVGLIIDSRDMLVDDTADDVSGAGIYRGPEGSTPAHELFGKLEPIVKQLETMKQAMKEAKKANAIT